MTNLGTGCVLSNGTLWTVSKFYGSLWRDGEQIKIMGMIFFQWLRETKCPR